MNKEVWIFKHGKMIKASRWDIWMINLYHFIHRFKIVDTQKYDLILHSDKKYYFSMTPEEYKKAEEIYKEKGTISYEFYPIGGIDWGIKLHVLKTGEIIDLYEYR